MGASTRLCEYPDCGRPHKGRGLCAGHLLQQREGRPPAPLRTIALAKTHLADRLSANSRLLDCGCIEWTGTRHNSGYGQMSYRGKSDLTHRHALVAAGVDLPPDMEVNHLCGFRRCINVDHLEVVTPAENAQYKTMSYSEVGVRGVAVTPQGRYQAKVNFGKKQYCFGTFGTIDEAEQAVIAGRRSLGFHEPDAPCDHSDVTYPRPSRSRH